MWTEILTAVSLLFVLEGLLPFISPDGYKRSMTRVIQMHSQHLRLFGFVSMLSGVVLLYFVR
jgi:uncharacterized protein YjeT (DUF2065 family)